MEHEEHSQDSTQSSVSKQRDYILQSDKSKRVDCHKRAYILKL